MGHIKRAHRDWPPLSLISRACPRLATDPHAFSAHSRTPRQPAAQSDSHPPEMYP